MVKKIPLSDTNYFSKIFLDYINEEEKLKDFFQYNHDITGFDAILKHAKDYSFDRKLLKRVFIEQYDGFEITEAVTNSIQSLEHSDTFTICTGHQLNLCTGPLYFIYKIITTINLARKLKESFPTHHFVPVYWMATEDHDFEEINHFILFGKKYQWQTQQQGPVGRFDTSEVAEVISTINENIDTFKEAYKNYSSLSEATRYLVNELFGNTGLLIMDADQRDCKKLFIPIILDEVLNQSGEKLINETNAALLEKGYEPQAHVREINLFYLQKGARNRIVKQHEKYQILNTDIVFTQEELVNAIHSHPEMFSPNVLLRPLYQQVLLPNIAYIGGPAEITYWLQLKRFMDHNQLLFPVLVSRNFAMIVNKIITNKIEKINFKVEDFFKSEDQLKSLFIEKFTDMDIIVTDQRQMIKRAFDDIASKAMEIDKTLQPTVLAEKQKSEKSLDDIEKKFKKVQERKNEEGINQVLNIKNKLFPQGNLQERTENVLNFLLTDDNFLNKVYEMFDPFDPSFYIITYHD